MDREVDINFHPMALNKFAKLKARREAAGLYRGFYWLTEADRKMFDEMYRKTESYRIKEEIKRGLRNEKQS